MRESIEKVKICIKDNKKEIIVAGVSVLVGATTMYFVGRRIVVSQQKVQNIALLNWKPENNLQQITIVELPPRGHRGDRIFCNELKRFFSSQGDAARELGLNQGNISSHLNGKNDHVGGYTFKNLGENLTGNVEVSS